MDENTHKTTAPNHQGLPQQRQQARTNSGGGGGSSSSIGGAVKNDIVGSSRGSDNKKSSLVPSASSIVLDFLAQNAKRIKSESQVQVVMSSPALPVMDHTNSTAAASAATNNNSEMSINTHQPASVAVASAEAVADGIGGTSSISNTNNNGQTSSSASAPPTSANSTQQQNHKSVVPQLMDIYNDLTESSTPQTVPPPSSSTASMPLNTMPAFPQNPMPTGVYYSGGDQSSLGGTTIEQRRSIRRRSNSSVGQYNAAAARPPLTAPVAPTSSRFTTTTATTTSKKVKASSSSSASISEMQTSRKKGKSSSSDQRWSKRFTWPDELHRDFVSAIFDVGLKHSSPSAIMEFMRPNPDVTSERVKSHLQKYRNSKEKSRKEFMTSYDCALDGFQKRQQQQGEQEDAGEASIGHSFSCGEAAALCTHASIAESRHSNSQGSSMEGSRRSSPVQMGVAPPPISSASQVSSEGEGVGTLHMPLLTTQEKEGPIGQAFGCLVGMFQSLSQQLEDSRQQPGTGGGQQHVHSSTQVVQSSQSQAVAQHQHEPHQQMSQQHHVHQQQQVYHQTVEQAAATAASLHANDPSIHQVAASIPHAFMVGSQPAVQSSHSRGYAGGGHPQQHHAQPPHPQYHHVQAPVPSNSQHPSNHYTGAAAAPAPQGEYIPQDQVVHPPQPMQQPQYAYGAPAPQPAHAHHQRAAPFPVYHAAGHHHQVHQPQKYAPSTHQYSPHDIPAISHHGQQPPPRQPAFAPRNPPPPRATQHQPAGPLGNAPAPAMHHPSAPQTHPTVTSAPRTYANKVTNEQYPSQHQASTCQHHAATSQQAPAPAPDTQPNAENSCETNVVTNPLSGTGRTLQAQKESTMMKQEMQGQMAFQNKIRALKQIELSKYGGKEHP
ncbi:hypothetical protein ACHAXR_007624, partial [Thalassiosira sp. AJA248-18]